MYIYIYISISIYMSFHYHQADYHFTNAICLHEDTKWKNFID